MKSFYDATSVLGVADKVTTFTLSDFGRTFQPAAGSRLQINAWKPSSHHGWGGQRRRDVWQLPGIAAGGADGNTSMKGAGYRHIRRSVRGDAR